MDTDRLLRIFGRMMDTHGSVFIGAGAAVIGLLLLVFIARKLRSRKTKKAEAANTIMAAPTIGADDDIALDMSDGDPLDPAMMDDFDDADIIADMKADMSADMTGEMMGEKALVIDELDEAVAHRFDADTSELDDIDDITIPKIGEAPPPKQSRFFSASWLGKKDKKDAPTISLDMTPSSSDMPMMQKDSSAHKDAAECARLGEIERRLMALRELYEAGLIAPEVYVIKAREFAAQI